MFVGIKTGRVAACGILMVCVTIPSGKGIWPFRILLLRLPIVCKRLDIEQQPWESGDLVVRARRAIPMIMVLISSMGIWARDLPTPIILFICGKIRRGSF